MALGVLAKSRGAARAMSDSEATNETVDLEKAVQCAELEALSQRAEREERPQIFEQLAECHSLPMDDEMYDGYRKDTCKKLINAILNGGSYDGWIRGTLKRDPSDEPKLPFIQKLINELARL